MNDDLRVLRDLPERDAPADVAARVRRQAQAELARTTENALAALVTRLCARVLVPAVLTCTVVVYLSWAVGAASSLYR
jgi:hypothetical protein